MSLPLVTLCLVLSAAQCRAQAADTSAIDFSAAGGAVVDPDTGAVCVEREEEVEKVEQLSEQQCTQQTVSQCYNSYNTQYRDVVREECREVYIKTCRIVMRERSYNHSSRVCRRPLVKQCAEPLASYNGYGAPPPPRQSDVRPETVCHTLYETKCNNTNGVTVCDQVERQICAEDNCALVEGEEECDEFLVENSIDVPEETCNIEPTRECRDVTTSVPQLIPEEVCRDVPKELCQTVFLNPKTVKVTDTVKYCMNEEGGADRVNERLNLISDGDEENELRDPRRKVEKLILRQPRRQNQVSDKKKTGAKSNRDRLLSG